MKTLNQLLVTARQRHHLSLAQLHQRTLIPRPVLEALEAGDYANLPPAALVQGALEILAEELDVDSDTLLALYRRDGAQSFSSTTSGSTTRRRRTWRQRLRFHVLSPRGVSWAAAGGVLILATLGLSWQWWQLSQPPELAVSQPADYATLTNPVTIAGKTQAENTVTINTEVVSLDLEGNFSTVLTLPPGERTLVIEATDQRGRSQQVVRFIRIE
jgi:cytoskeletal protein RodZ